MHRVVVLGGGWLGTAAVEAGRAAHMKVEIVDRSSHPGLFRPFSGALLRSVVGDAIAVINACGLVSGPELELELANHTLARLVASAVNPTETRLVHIGSAAEYGVPASPRVHENDPTDPIGPYGRSKLAGTRAVLEESRPGQGVVARVFNPVGPGQPAHLPVAEFARAARSADPGPLVLRNADTERDFVAIHDVGRALIALATVPELTSSVVNVCSGYGLRYGDLARTMLDLLGSRRSVESLGEPVVARVVGDPTHLLDTTGLDLRASASKMAELALA